MKDSLQRTHDGLADRAHLGDAADDLPMRGRHARAVEIKIDLRGHRVGLLGDLARQRRRVALSLVDKDGKRRLQSVREIADMGTRALHDLLVGLEERVQLLL